MSTSISKDGVALPPLESVPPIPQSLPPEIYEQRVAVAMALRTQGWTVAEVAAQFNVTAPTVRSWFRRARAEGRLTENITDMLDRDTVFRSLEVVHDKLEEGDVETALAILKGRGQLRNYNNNNAVGSNQVTGIQIIYSTPSGAPPPLLTDVSTLPGQIVGRGRSDEEPVP